MAMITKLDQYLAMRKDRYYYSRRVPKLYRLLDGRRPVRCSLNTSSLEVARARRDLLAEADDHYWASLCATMGHEDTGSVNWTHPFRISQSSQELDESLKLNPPCVTFRLSAFPSLLSKIRQMVSRVTAIRAKPCQLCL